MASCLQGLLNTAPWAKAPERKNEGKISGWSHSGLQHTELILELTITCPQRPLYPAQRVCVLCCVRGDEEHVCGRVPVCARGVLAKSAAAFILTHGSIPSDLSIQKMNNPLLAFFFSFACGVSFWNHPLPFTSLSLFQFSFFLKLPLSHNFFQSHCLTLPSSFKLCRGHNLDPSPFLLECH